MPRCQNCENDFPNRIVVEGKEYFLHKRKYCLDCNPLGQKRFWGGKLAEAQGRRLRKRTFVCKECGKTRKQKTRNNRCSTCRSKQVRGERKFRAIKELGGKCSICDYSKCSHALDFHHLDRKLKRFTISRIWEHSWETISAELKKCILVCCRCHAEIHAGITSPGGEIGKRASLKH